MSIQKTRTGSYAVRWREGGRMRSQTFRLKRDAERFDVKIKGAKQTGTLSALDGGRETLDDYVEHTWAPIHAAALAPKTQTLYAGLYDGHISPRLGGYQLRELTPELVGRWQADRLVAGAPIESTRKALTLLGGILQRAVEAGRIASNPQRLVRKAAAPATQEVRPLAPTTVEAIRALLPQRDAMFVALLAYAGLRPQEARALRWGHVGERTLTVHVPKTRRHSTQPRSVKLLAPIAQDLREWRLLSGRPDNSAPVIPALDTHGRPSGGVWSEVGYEQWITPVWAPALEKVGLGYQRPYDCRHSFASLLIHEGRSIVSVAAQLGHSPALCLRVYAHVLAELEDAPRISAEDAIRGRAAAAVCVQSASRPTDVPQRNARSLVFIGHPGG
jgi:integrase